MKHPSVGLFEAEHALFTTDSEDIATLFKFIFNTHEFLSNGGDSGAARPDFN
jgi:hypothetical protein